MRIREKLKVGGSKVISTAMAGVLAVGLMPLPAFAADLQTGSTNLKVQADALLPDDDIIAAAYAAANPAPEILGLDNPNQRSTGEAEQTYEFFGNPDINDHPDPYLYNTHNGLTPAVVIGGRGGSPMSRLNAFDTTDNTAAQNAVWALRPHIILGTGSDTIPANEHDFYVSDARTVESALNWEANSYNPIGVTYNRVTLPTMIQTMYRLAKAANEVHENDSSLNARYGDPVEIAKNYERYILGQKGLVKQAIDSGKVKERTIALVQSYDSSAKTYTIITDGVAEGTATTNRYLEAVQGVAKNYFDTVGSGGTSATVTADQLKNNVDLLIVGGQASMDSSLMAGYLAADGLLGRTYYCVNWANGSAFGTTVNSVENAQNIGRILPCVYPEVLDQSDMIAYYYDEIYHLKSGVVANEIGSRMDGVRNWSHTDSAAYTTWEAADVEGYSVDNVQSQLVAGVSYLNKQSGLSSYLTPTDNLKSDSVSLSDAKVTVSAGVISASGAAEPKPTVEFGGKTLVEGADYTVSYSNNKTAGETATVTVTGARGSAYEGTSKTANFMVVDSENFTEANVNVTLSRESYAYTGSAIEPTPTVSLKSGGSELMAGTDYVIKYDNNVVVPEANSTAVPTITLTGIGNYAGTLTKTFTITKGTQTVSVDPNVTKKADLSATSPVSKFDGDEIEATFFAKASFGVFASTTGNGALEFSSSDKDVADIDKQGMVSIKKVGTTTLTVKAAGTTSCDEASKEVKLTVNKLEKQAISVGAAQQKKISATAADAPFSLKASTNGDGTLSYSSSNDSVATVKDGMVTVVGVGEAKITVSASETTNAGAGSETVTLTVTKKAATIAASDVSVALGSTGAVGASVDSGAALTYECSNPAIAAVNPATGAITPVAIGTAEIVISAPETSAYTSATKTITVTVTAAPAMTSGATEKGVSAGTGTTVDVKATSATAVTLTSASVANNGTVSIDTVTINGNTYNVTAVGASAFKGTKAKKVTVGNNVTTIGKQAFQNAKKLTTVSLGKNVKTVGKNAFKGASKLKKVTLKSSKLTKTSLKNLVKNSKIKTVKLSGVSKKAKKNYKKWAKSLKITVK